MQIYGRYAHEGRGGASDTGDMLGVGIPPEPSAETALYLLRELRLLVEQYSIEISCTAPTLAELAGNSGGEFGRLLCECSGSETDIRRAWSNAVDRLSAEPGCGGEEVSLLRELGRELGTCPAESQLALLKLYSARFDKLISAAEKSAEQQGRMYRSGGVLAGLGAAVMLL